MKPGIHPQTGNELDDALREQLRVSDTTPSVDDLNVTWVGDFDQYGAECGHVMNALLPRPDDAPLDAVSQHLVDTYGLDENGHLKLDRSLPGMDFDEWVAQYEDKADS